jgi:hypothetical protein
MREHSQVTPCYSPGFIVLLWHEHHAIALRFSKARHCYITIRNLHDLDQKILASTVIFESPCATPVLVYNPHLASTQKDLISFPFTCHLHTVREDFCVVVGLTLSADFE